MSIDEKKYEFISDYLTLPDGSRVHRIRALKSFGQGNNIVESGQIGGYLLKEDNLSHSGDCWVSDDAIVCDNAKVSGSVVVFGNAKVRGDVTLSGDSRVGGDLIVYGESKRDRFDERTNFASRLPASGKPNQL